MATVTEAPTATLADLLKRLGNVPLDRIRLRPPIGSATEDDVLVAATRDRRWCELIDGTLVEKPMGFDESFLASFINRILGNYVAPRNLGHVTTEQGMMRIAPGLVRIPDVAFISWERFPNRRRTGEPIPDLVPDLAIEVLSPSNTSAEMDVKLAEYFSAGVRQVWIVNPATRTIALYDEPDSCQTLTENDTLRTERLLPDFSFSVRELFAELDRHG